MMTINQKMVFSALGFVQVVLLFLMIFNDRGLVDLEEIREVRAVIELENKKLDKKCSDLARRVKRLGSDMGYVESVARKDFGMITDDELIFQFGGTGRGVK